MKVEDSKYINLKHKKEEFHFGKFYFFDKIIIGEVNEGVHFDTFKVIQVIDKIYNYYGQNFKAIYIANRVNSYSTNPHTWSKLQKRGDNFLIAAALISYNPTNYKVAAVEKKLSTTYLKRCVKLEEAINWAENIIKLQKK